MYLVPPSGISGEVYRGKLVEAEDNMNSQMSDITVTYRDGRVAQLENVFIRGSKVRFVILPDMLKNAPMLKNLQGPTRGGRGRGGPPRGKAGAFSRGMGSFILYLYLVVLNYISCYCLNYSVKLFFKL